MVHVEPQLVQFVRTNDLVGSVHVVFGVKI
jgi:hypothetical protein